MSKEKNKLEKLKSRAAEARKNFESSRASRGMDPGREERVSGLHMANADWEVQDYHRRQAAKKKKTAERKKEPYLPFGKNQLPRYKSGSMKLKESLINHIINKDYDAAKRALDEALEDIAEAHLSEKRKEIATMFGEETLDEGRHKGIGNKKRGASLARQTADLRNTFDVAPGKRRRQGPRTAKLEEGILSNIKNRLSGRRKDVMNKIHNKGKDAFVNGIAASELYLKNARDILAGKSKKEVEKGKKLADHVNNKANISRNWRDRENNPSSMKKFMRGKKLEEGKLKNWAIDFEEKHGRKPTNDDMRSERETKAYEARGRIAGHAQRIRDEKLKKKLHEAKKSFKGGKSDFDFGPSGLVLKRDEKKKKKWNYPKEMTKTKETSDMGTTNAAKNRKDRKEFRKKIKAKAHSDLMTGKK